MYTLWIYKDFLLKDVAVVPLIQHYAGATDRKELSYLNLTITWLEENVEIRFFEDISEAGPLVLLPHGIAEYISRGKMDEVKAFHRQLIREGKTPLVFELSWEYRKLKGEIVIANTMYQGFPSSNEIAAPLWGYDNGQRSYDLDKPEKPTVNFMGSTEYDSPYNRLLFRHFLFPSWLTNWLATKPWFRNRSLYYPILFFRKVIARQVRKRVVGRMRSLKNMKVSIVERNGIFFEMPAEERAKNRQEYLDAMASHAYTVICRGDANCAFTFYEILSFGRIPVWIDTATVFPELKDGLRYEDFSIIVPFSELDTLEERIQRFHDTHDPAEFQEACRKARRAYEQLLPNQFIPDMMESHFSQGHPVNA